MRSPGGTLRLMLVIALIPVLADGAMLWRGRFAVLTSLLALYHSITQFCRHAVTPGAVEVATGLVAGGVVLGGLVAIRGAQSLQRRCSATRRQVARLLLAGTAAWPRSLATMVHELGLTEHVTLVQADAPLACCAGLWRPRILVSTGLVNLLTPAELSAVLLHEEYHRRHHEPSRMLLVAVLADAFSFLPLLGELRARYEAAKECAADAAAVAAQHDVAPLAGALYKLLSCGRPEAEFHGLAIGRLSVTERRIERLLTPTPTPLPALSPGGLIATSLVLVAAVLPVVPIAVVSVQPLLDTCRHS